MCYVTFKTRYCFAHSFHPRTEKTLLFLLLLLNTICHFQSIPTEPDVTCASLAQLAVVRLMMVMWLAWSLDTVSVA